MKGERVIRRSTVTWDGSSARGRGKMSNLLSFAARSRAGYTRFAFMVEKSWRYFPSITAGVKRVAW
jgi:hypothetical protein